MNQKDIDRFWSKVDKSGECWAWLGTVSNGHCVVRFDSRTQYAVRVAWELVRGTPPLPRINLRRTCNTPLCVRPDHRAPFIAADKPPKMPSPVRNFADIPEIACTYYILNHINHRIYVGMTWNMQQRFRAHLGGLRNNHHPSSALQTDWNAYGEQAFEFGMLVDECYPYIGIEKRPYSREKPESFEDIFVRTYQSDNPAYGYNIGHFEGRAGLAYTHLAKLNELADLWNIGGKRRDSETIRRCIDYTYQLVISDTPA